MTTRALALGTHRVRVAGLGDAAVTDVDAWGLDYTDALMGPFLGTHPPRPMRVTVTDGVAIVDFDFGLAPGLLYDITPPDLSAAEFEAPHVDGGPAPGEPWLDVDAPIIRGDGSHGGDYRVGVGGDRRLVGGIATATKAIWHVLLRDASPIRWKESAPVDLREEARRLERALAVLPLVDRVSVELVRRGDHFAVRVTADTPFGPIDTERGF